MASTDEAAQPWFESWPDMLSGYVADLRAEGWGVAELLRNASLETVWLRISGLPAPPATLVLVLGPATPYVPAIVLDAPRGPIEHWGRYGQLCLPESAGSPVNRVRAAIDLYKVDAEDEPAWAAIGHLAAEPRTNLIRLSPRHTSLLTCDLPAGRWGTFSFAGRADAHSLFGRVRRIESRSPASSASEPAVLAENLAAALGPAQHRTGVWVRVDNREFPLGPADLLRLWRSSLPDGAEELAFALGVIERFPESLVGQDLPQVQLAGLIVPEESTQRGVWAERFLVLVEREAVHFKGAKVSAVPTEEFGREFARVPGLEALQDKTVAVAGLGMLGAPVAETLARSGTREIRLLDRGRVTAGNLIRQPYDVRDIGTAKARALRSHLTREAPWCAVPQEHTVDAEAQSPRAEIVRWLDGVDLLVLATANRDANLYLADIASDLGIPLVVGWVTYGIWGGVAYSTTWGVTGCPGCLEIDPALDSMLKNTPTAPGADEELWIPGCASATFPGNAFDGAILSSVLGRLVLNQLAPSAPPPGPLATVSLRSSSDASGPRVDWHDFPAHDGCHLCARSR